MAVKFLTGKDYPHLCAVCRAAIDGMTMLYREGLVEDTDDEEAPCRFVYDHALFCGGRECRNPPQNAPDRERPELQEEQNDGE
jgi:hypothetical protein